MEKAKEKKVGVHGAVWEVKKKTEGLYGEERENQIGAKIKREKEGERKKRERKDQIGAKIDRERE